MIRRSKDGAPPSYLELHLSTVDNLKTRRLSKRSEAYDIETEARRYGTD